MIRSAYLTTGLAIKTLSSLLKANVEIHGQENIPDRPIIFVINHFTRIETFILPYNIFKLTGIPVWSLASSKIFQGGFGHFLEMVGAVSTKDPERDELIIKSLLTGEGDWIIFPEGSMVKTKKIIQSGNYMIADPKGAHEPHTGAATLALRAALFQRYLLLHAKNKSQEAKCSLNYLGLESIEEMRDKSPVIMPVNLTYYPIRARENLASLIAEKMIKGVPKRILEELMTEGTMLLSGVDLDIRFGKAITVDDILDQEIPDNELTQNSLSEVITSVSYDDMLATRGKELMQKYMHSIYSMTTINHEHLLASYLRLYPYKRIHVDDLLRRVYYASLLLQECGTDLHLHKSLKEDQSHLVIDDKYQKFENFLQIALDKKIVSRDNNILIRDNRKLSAPISFHRGRIDNPVEVIANEVEPLKKLQKLIWSLAWQPDFLLKKLLAFYLYKQDKKQYSQARQKWCLENKIDDNKAPPLLYTSTRRKTGVLLVHSYLANPQEIKELALNLNKQGYWVYAPRLPGHGTCADDLAETTHEQWIEAVNKGFILLSNLCEQVVVGGIAVGGSLALHLGSCSHRPLGIFALSSPYKLKNYSTKFMPSVDVWDQMIQKFKGQQAEQKFLPFETSNPHINYIKNPISGIREVGILLDNMRNRLDKINTPVLLIHGDEDTIIAPESSEKIFRKLAVDEKELSLLCSQKHILIRGEKADTVFQKITAFIQKVTH